MLKFQLGFRCSQGFIVRYASSSAVSSVDTATPYVPTKRKRKSKAKVPPIWQDQFQTRMPRVDTKTGPKITVMGVGGAGGNAVDNMIATQLEGVEFLVANTDYQALARSTAERKMALGESITRGLGAGSKPELGRLAAEAHIDELKQSIAGSHMLFITGGRIIRLVC